MTLVERAGRWTSLLVYPLVLLLVLLPSLFMEVYTSETFKVNQEFLIVTLGWTVIVVVAASRALQGLPVLGGGRSSWARMALGGLFVWILLTSAFAFNAPAAWMYAASALTYLLVAQSLLDWIEAAPERRNFVIASVAGLVGVQTVFGLAQLAKLPLVEWSKSMPVFLDNGRVLPWSYWLKDAVAAVGVAAKDGRAIGTVGNINYLAEFYALTLPLVLAWTLTLKRLWVKAILAIVVLAAFAVMVTTGARAAMVGVVFASVVAAVFVFGKGALDPRQWLSTTRGKVIVAIGTVAAIAALVLVGGRVLAKFEASGGLSDTSITSRAVNWEAAVRIAKENPVLGTGLGGYKLNNVQELGEIYPNSLPEGAARTRFMQAHNEPLQGAAELGFFGLFLCLTAFAFWYRETLLNESMARPLRFGLLAGVGSLLLASLFGFPFHIPVTAMMVMIALALGLAGREPAPAPVFSSAGRLGYALVAIVLLGVAGHQVYTKSIWPNYIAHRYLYVAEKVAAKENSETALITLSLADRFDRFRGSVRWKILKALVLGDEPEAALKLFEASQREGLGKDATYWKARALEDLGRNREAYVAFEDLTQYYPKNHAMHKRGKSAMKRLKDMPDGPPKKKAT